VEDMTDGQLDGRTNGLSSMTAEMGRKEWLGSKAKSGR
jgi:hypothetical protein